MRILFVTATYPPSVGGAQAHVHRVASGLVERGHLVEVVTSDVRYSPGAPDPGFVGPAREVRDGVEVRRLPLARRLHRGIRQVDRLRLRLWRGRRVAHPLRVGPWGARLIGTVATSARRVDVVVGSPAPFITAVAVPSLARGRTASVVMPLLHLGPDGTTRPPGPVRWALRRSDATTASTTVELEAQVALGVERDRIAVLPPGCDPDRYDLVEPSAARRSLGLPDRPTVGYVGRLTAYKGIDTLVAAMERVWAERPDTGLLLAGSVTAWTGFDDLVARARAAGGDRVIVRRDFAEEDRPALLAACDVVATPSREESFGMVNAEAWCAARPVVAADIPAVRSVVRDDVDGLLVGVGDGPAWATALDGLLADADRRTRMGECGRARAERELSWDVVLDGWEVMLDRTVDRRRGGVS